MSFAARTSCHIPAECRHTAPETPPGGAPSCWGHSERFLPVPTKRGHPAAVHCTSCLKSPFSLQRKQHIYISDARSLQGLYSVSGDAARVQRHQRCLFCTVTLAFPMALRACDCSCSVMCETESATTSDLLWNMCSTACRQTCSKF